MVDPGTPVQQRELGMPPEATPTVTGGMSFAGGPFNSFGRSADPDLYGGGFAALEKHLES